MTKLQRIIAAIILIVGMALIGIGIYLVAVPAIPEEFAATAQATIIDIQVSHTSGTSSNQQRTVFVAYEVVGETYEGVLGYYHSGMAVGQEVEIQYDVRNPQVISSPGGRQFGIILCFAIGGVFAALGVFLSIKPVPLAVFVNRRRVA